MQGSITARERERLEKTIEEEVSSQVSFYKGWRDTEREELCEQIKSNPSKEVRAALESFDKATKLLRGHGYEFNVRYTTSEYVEAVATLKDNKQLKDFDKQTEDIVGKLQSIKRHTLMKLYTATGTDDILNELVAEIHKVIGEPARKTCPGAQVPR